MSGPGAFEPSPAEEYIPAAIKGTGWTRGDALPSESKPGEDELWFIQAPGDVSVEDLRGLRFKLAGEGAGAEMATFKAGGKKYRMVEEDAETASRMFVLPRVGEARVAPAARVTRRVTLMEKRKAPASSTAGGAGEDAGQREKGKKKTRQEQGERQER